MNDNELGRSQRTWHAVAGGLAAALAAGLLWRLAAPTSMTLVLRTERRRPRAARRSPARSLAVVNPLGRRGTEGDPRR